MSCCFNNCFSFGGFNNQCCQPRPNPCCIPGPMGPMGPMGPSGTASVAFLNLYSSTVAANTIIPLTLSSATASNPVTVSGGTATLPAGTYAVTYEGSPKAGTAGGDASLSLYANGNAISGETITTSLAANVTGNLSRTVVLSFATTTTLALYNSSAISLTFINVSMVIQKIA